MCGALRASDAGSSVVLMGWVNRRRDLGSLIFIDLRDRTGITQVVISAEADPELHKKAESLRSEFVIAVIGRVKLRDAATINKNIPTGEIEVVADELRILNDCKPLPFSPSDNDIANEEVRLKYRYLDLRRTEMQYNIELRHRVALAIREYLNAQGFFEIETPFMTRSTPEGARDYLVPSRVHPGEFYALPQSPQQFKQILMISGFDKYFQIARCFRDEDLRADRQPEFTQIDLEMSFARPEMVYAVVEGFLTAAWKTIGVDICHAVPAHDLRRSHAPLRHRQARHAPARDDRRALGVRARESGDAATSIPTADRGHRHAQSRRALAQRARRNQAAVRRSQGRQDFRGHQAAGEVVPRRRRKDSRNGEAEAGRPARPCRRQQARRSRASAAESLAKQANADLRRRRTIPSRPRPEVRRHATEPSTAATSVSSGSPTSPCSSGTRPRAAGTPPTIPSPRRTKKTWAASRADPGAARSLAYDVVLNGTELGSGSIRIHRQDIQSIIFKALGMSPDEQQARFGYFLEALQYGTPPHGGIALGLDRIVMILAGATSLREVIPFPKTAKAIDLMMDAPTPVSDKQLKELGIAVVSKKDL